jgi:hypothetical protein
MAAEYVPVRGPALCDRIFQGPRNVFLPDDFGEFLRAVFSGEDLIAHG